MSTNQQNDFGSIKKPNLVAMCLIQHRLIEVLMFEIERLMNATSGADAESNKTLQDWLNGVSNRIRGASADIQKIIDADTKSTTPEVSPLQ
jgi:hypothetical protein